MVFRISLQDSRTAFSGFRNCWQDSRIDIFTEKKKKTVRIAGQVFLVSDLAGRIAGQIFFGFRISWQDSRTGIFITGKKNYQDSRTGFFGFQN